MRFDKTAKKFLDILFIFLFLGGQTTKVEADTLFPPVQSSPASTASSPICAELGKIISQFRGNVTLAAKDLKTGEMIEIRGEDRVPTASVIKLPILVEAFYQIEEGKLSLDDLVLLSDRDKVRGSGVLQDLRDGLILSFQDVLTLMIVESDNTATNLVIDRVSLERVNARLQALGLVSTKLNKKVFFTSEKPSEDEKKFGLGVTTAREMVSLLEKLDRGELASPRASQQMIDLLKKQRDRDQIPRFLPAVVRGGVQVAHKTGALEQVRNDVGLVYTSSGGRYALAIFCFNSEDKQWTPDNEASLTIARLAQAVVSYFEQQAKSTTPRP